MTTEGEYRFADSIEQNLTNKKDYGLARRSLHDTLPYYKPNSIPNDKTTSSLCLKIRHCYGLISIHSGLISKIMSSSRQRKTSTRNVIEFGFSVLHGESAIRIDRIVDGVLHWLAFRTGWRL